ncbi:MAG: hypothetical protein AAF666_17015 [Pseudomonadota bacterium]
MNDDSNRDAGRGIGDVDGLFSERPGGALGPREAGAAAQDGNAADAAAAAAASGAPKDAAVAKHRAAKQARVRARREEMRRKQAAARGLGEQQADAGERGADNSAAADAKLRADAAPPKRPGKGSALPALRPDIKPDTPALRAERVEAIRRDLVRRRRRKGVGMLFKLWLFVMVPTMLVGAFFWFEASDLYKSESTFVVRSAGGAGGGSGGGILGALMGGGGGSLSDPVAVQTFAQSRDVLTRLDADHAWIAHFQDPALDYFHRLQPDATFEDAFKAYRGLVSISYDPTEGIVEMAVVASDPYDAQRFNQAIIDYAEEMVDRLSDRLQRDAVADAEASFEDSRKELTEAQLAFAEAQKQSEVFSVESEVTAKMTLIGQLEALREEEKSRLASLLRVTTQSDARVSSKQARIGSLSEQIAALRANIAGNRSDEQTLADINAEMIAARLNVETNTAIFAAALERLKVVEAEAAQKQRYLETVSSPSLPDEANYPKKLEMTALAFLGFLGFYIIASLTLSLIREQASI